MADSTSIEALPAPGGGNVKLGITEQTPVQMPQQSMPTLVPNSVQNSGIQGTTNSPPTMAFAPASAARAQSPSSAPRGFGQTIPGFIRYHARSGDNNPC